MTEECPAIPTHLSRRSPKAAHIEGIHRRERIRAVAAVQYVPQAAAFEFCVEFEQGKVLYRNGEPWRMEHLQAVYFAEQLKVQRDPLPTDIFHNTHKLKLTNRMQVVAPGPNGAARYEDLRDDCFTIVVNKAIEIEGIRKDLWMVADSNAHVYKDAQCGWFKYGIENHFDIACFDSGYLLEYYPDVPFTFDWGPLLEVGFAVPLPMVCRGGCTISAQAVQAAYWLGAKEIVLCGVDCKTNGYYDGSSSGVPKREGRWGWVIFRFDELLRYMIEQGIGIITMTETALTAPRLEDATR